MLALGGGWFRILSLGFYARMFVADVLRGGQSGFSNLSLAGYCGCRHVKSQAHDIFCVCFTCLLSVLLSGSPKPPFSLPFRFPVGFSIPFRLPFKPFYFSFLLLPSADDAMKA